jgi:hypothetical protein
VFRREMAEKLAQIFGFQKTTYNAPSVNASTGSFEQDILFIEIDKCTSSAKQGLETAKVEGSFVVFTQMNKMPFGYFNKRIQQAEHSLTKNFFFHDIDLNPNNSPARIQNISERRVRFIYLYSAQYDPEHGELTSVEGI